MTKCEAKEITIQHQRTKNSKDSGSFDDRGIAVPSLADCWDDSGRLFFLRIAVRSSCML